jgi:hypothetical protein
MNYLAHGWRFVDEPYLLAGTAVPDMLSVVDRSIRARSKMARPYVEHSSKPLALVARGVIQHHHDDAWFHQTRVFAELSIALTAVVRDALDQDAGFRPSFLGHILVELLIDASLTDENPQRLEDYYKAWDAVDATEFAQAVSTITQKDASAIAWFVERFRSVRFLQDYGEDAKLLVRLNQVMHRVGLPALPSTFQNILPEVRSLVDPRVAELLSEPAAIDPGEPT